MEAVPPQQQQPQYGKHGQQQQIESTGEAGFGAKRITAAGNRPPAGI